MVNNLVRGCRLWDKLTEKMNDGDYDIPETLKSDKLEGGGYSEVDYRHLACRITGNSAEVVVGDAPEHRTKIDTGRKRLEYFDPDNATNLGVAQLMRSIGLRCKVQEGRGVFCTGATERKAVMIFRALVMVPSMDRRMEWCRGRRDAAYCRQAEIDFFGRSAKRDE